MLALLPGLYLGWEIGAHDAGNSFGPQVGAGVISYNTPIVAKVAISMAAAPVGAGGIAYLLYTFTIVSMRGRLGGLLMSKRAVTLAGVVFGCYAAYALGSNHVGNAMAPVVAVGLVDPAAGAALGGVAIAVGVLTYSRRLILVIGKQITALDPISALIAVLASALTVHLFTQLSIPVSTSQATVGAVVGVGLTKGMMAVFTLIR
jgi:PiT family inorganic phosphate transporter